jgi:hypothetical protein
MMTLEELQHPNINSLVARDAYVQASERLADTATKSATDAWEFARLIARTSRPRGDA